MDYTSINESRRLFKLGLNPKTANMCWISKTGGATYHLSPTTGETTYYHLNPTAMPWKNYTEKESCLPCWSSGVILEMLKMFHPSVEYSANGSWIVQVDFGKAEGTSLIEACVNMMVWFLEKYV